MMIHVIRLFIVTLMLLLFAVAASGQIEREAGCKQANVLRNSLIKEAEQEQFNVLYVEFIGNTGLSGRRLFGKSKPALDEGDIFTRKKLELALKRVSSIKSIYPLTMENTEVRL